ncbi:alkyl hydroperoxide reductase [Aliikangiella coralliicola]|uniref:Alkyl hydroperoxide reductase n=1 Tax=Aliikangiella coralliicola TaxID=2592383 RepID=A0A545UF30_9GAMM|nr:alkyl hydroperoxide reductase [Aliikangiella coralliicola]TQV87993.1 alkyl hydroperoxide reductase [Aliikangiella coralliicola]
MNNHLQNNSIKISTFKAWFKAAAIYNLVWGSYVVFLPSSYFELIGMPPPSYLAIWQVVGMCILVYAPGYWWASKDPIRFRHYIVIGLLGKMLGPVGFLWSAYQGLLPIEFGLTLLLNDLIWWPVFILFLRQMAIQQGGWLKLVKGE